MSDLYLRQWTDSPPHMNQFRWTTKMTDFNNPYSKKNLLELIFNFTSPSVLGTSLVVIEGRDKPSSTFSILGTFILSNAGATSEAEKSITKRMKLNVRNVLQYQFRFWIWSQATTHTQVYNPGVNDMNIVYRTFRDVSTDRLAGD